MFGRFDETRLRWIAARRSLLADAQLVADSVQPAAGHALRSITELIERMGEDGEALFRDVFFLLWLRELNKELIEVADGRSLGVKPGLVQQGLDLVANENRARPFPQCGGLSIFDRYVDVVHGSEFDYEVEWEFQINAAQWLSSLDKSLTLLQQHSPSRELVLGYTRYIAPLRNARTMHNISFSERRLPGVIFKNDELSPYLFAETLVHESDHQFYYALEEISSHWVARSALDDVAHYSPWRDDPRPLDGIMRGLSAFARVSHFYTAVLASADNNDLDAIARSLASRVVQCEHASSSLSKSQALSISGAEYVDEINTVLQQCKATLSQFDPQGRWLEAAKSVVTAHRTAWQHRNSTFVSQALE